MVLICQDEAEGRMTGRNEGKWLEVKKNCSIGLKSGF
jgi:hypothetical protein